MKKNKLPFVTVNLALLIILPFIFQYCASSKKTTEIPVSYETDIKPLMVRSCTPCHFPEQGRKKMLDTYAATKENITDILRRVQLNPAEDGYMPFKSKREAFSPEEIQLVKNWAKQNMPE